MNTNNNKNTRRTPNSFQERFKLIMDLHKSMEEKKRAYTFYVLPSHGYLKVPVLEASVLGVKFSHYSYYNDRIKTLYLEEDCDAPKFLEAFKKRFNYEPKIIAKTRDDEEFIRNCHVLRY